MTKIRLINRNRNPIEISFSFRKKDAHANYLFMDIVPKLGDKENAFTNIMIDFDSIGQLIEKINHFVNGNCSEVKYSPLEEDFYLYILPNKFTKEEIISQMRNAGYSELAIKQIEEHPETYSLVLMIDTYKYERDIVTNTGIAYCMKVTKEDLGEFSEEMEVQFNLIKNN